MVQAGGDSRMDLPLMSGMPSNSSNKPHSSYPKSMVYLTVDSRVRLYLEAKDDRDRGDSQQFYVLVRVSSCI